MINHIVTEIVTEINAMSCGTMDAWKLLPTPRRREVAERIMEILCKECAGQGGAADAVGGLCLVLAEIIMANAIPNYWDILPERVKDRICEEIERRGSFISP